MVSCQDKSDGADCFGGICCGETCRKKASCCDDLDCSSTEECTSYRCASTGTTTIQDVPCSSGVCNIGATSCPADEEWKGTCREDGDDGICCGPSTSTSGDECFGEYDGTECDDGFKVCCDEECMECCTNDHCAIGDVCEYGYCSTPETPDVDYTLYIIIAVVAAGGIGAFLYFTKFKKKKGGDEELGGETSLEDEFY